MKPPFGSCRRRRSGALGHSALPFSSLLAGRRTWSSRALLLYFAVRLLWVLGTLVVYVVTIVGVIVLLVLIF